MVVGEFGEFGESSVLWASGNYAPNFAHYAILNFPKNSFIMLIIILFMLLIVIIILLYQ